jgi:hypothetical protein
MAGSGSGRGVPPPIGNRIRFTFANTTQGSLSTVPVFAVITGLDGSGAFCHEHGLGHRAYGFAYDDVNGQSSSLATPSPQAITISFRCD